LLIVVVPVEVEAGEEIAIGRRILPNSVNMTLQEFLLVMGSPKETKMGQHFIIYKDLH